MSTIKKIILTPIDTYFQINHKALVEVANNILGRLHMTDFKTTLVNDCYFYMKSKENEIMEENPNENRLKSIAINWMHKQIVWQKSDFKKTWIIKDFNEIDSINLLEEDTHGEDSLAFEKDYQDKINHINFKVSLLTLDKKILFELYQSGINNSSKLAKHTGLSRTGCYNLLKKFKEELREGYEKK